MEKLRKYIQEQKEFIEPIFKQTLANYQKYGRDLHVKEYWRGRYQTLSFLLENFPELKEK